MVPHIPAAENQRGRGTFKGDQRIFQGEAHPSAYAALRDGILCPEHAGGCLCGAEDVQDVSGQHPQGNPAEPGAQGRTDSEPESAA